MKKLFNISVLVFTILFCTSAFSQTIAIKAGLNFSKPSIIVDKQDMSDYYDTYTGFNAGVYGEYPLNDMFSIEAGLAYSQKGHTSEVKDHEYTNDGKTTFDFSYLDIPILGKIRHKFGDLTIAASAGFLLSTGLSGTMQNEEYYNYPDYPNGEITEITKIDIKWGDKEDEFKRLDYGPIFGIEFEFHSILLTGSYYHGLTNIINPGEYDMVYKHRVFQVTLGYKISI